MMKHPVCSYADLLAKGKLRVLVNEKPVLVIPFEGKVYALADKCPHKGAPLSPGKLDGAIIQCKEHGLQLDIRTGTVIDNLKAKFLVPDKDARSIKTFKTSIEGDQVFVEL